MPVPPVAPLDLRALITAGRVAVRASEDHASPHTIESVSDALCELPLTVLDARAEQLVHGALDALARARDAREWTMLDHAERAVSALLHEPDGATIQHPAVLAVATLAAHAAHVHGQMIEGSPERAAWERAHLHGLEALGATVHAVSGGHAGHKLDKWTQEFFTAVRRAIPYAALIVTRNALVEAARCYGLPVLGMRQPLPIGGRWRWARRVGDVVYLFRVVTPLAPGHPYGSVAVQRLRQDDTPGTVRYFPLSPDQDRRRAVIEALYRI
jgi:hypothetical protein